MTDPFRSFGALTMSLVLGVAALGTQFADALPAAATTAALSTVTQAAEQADFEIVEVRLHGNHRFNDEEILRLAGVTIGARMSASELAAVETRLRDSGQFETATVERRYRSLTRRDRVVLLITVQEKVSAASKFLVWPEIRYNEDDNFSVGARVSAKDLLGGDELISVPFTVGGVDRVAFEVSRSWASGFGVGGAYETRGEEHAHFEVRQHRSARICGRGSAWDETSPCG